MCLKKLLEQFESLRKDMIELGIKFGLKHPDVILKSKELDKLHIEILKKQKSNK